MYNILCFARFVTQLLMDLVYFVTEHDSSGEDILNIQVQSPNRDRQKLMREQNILKEVNYNTPSEENILKSIPLCCLRYQNKLIFWSAETFYTEFCSKSIIPQGTQVWFCVSILQ